MHMKAFNLKGVLCQSSLGMHTDAHLHTFATPTPGFRGPVLQLSILPLHACSGPEQVPVTTAWGRTLVRKECAGELREI